MNINAIPIKTEQKDKTNVGTQNSSEHIHGKKYCDIRKVPEQTASSDKQNLSKKNDPRKRKSLNDTSKTDQITQVDGAHDDNDITNSPKYNISCQNHHRMTYLTVYNRTMKSQTHSR